MTLLPGALPADAASQPATLSRTLWLEHTPGNTASVQRSIYLAAGTYSWWVQLEQQSTPVNGSQASRDIYLAAGWYDWTCTIGRSEWPAAYASACQLQKSGSTPARISSNPFEIDTVGYYTVSGYLLHVPFP
ncbi:hypothetical protein GCM10010222_26280 [Streptomyces tanashiensis]|nr:hypothetical protein GCM10010222_26280 [Streptomyces tanashiensis]